MKFLILLATFPSVFLLSVSEAFATSILLTQETEAIEETQTEAETVEDPASATETVESSEAETVETPSDDKYQGLTAVQWYNKGLDFIDAQDYQSAIDAFTNASELDDQDADTFYNLGYVRVIIGELEAAINDYTQAITLNPEYA
jgi:tetratricopeptide (TPR) repeat protein